MFRILFVLGIIFTCISFLFYFISLMNMGPKVLNGGLFFLSLLFLITCYNERYRFFRHK